MRESNALQTHNLNLFFHPLLWQHLKLGFMVRTVLKEGFSFFIREANQEKEARKEGIKSEENWKFFRVGSLNDQGNDWETL